MKQSMNKAWVVLMLFALPLLVAAESQGKVELLGDKGSIAFDEVKAIYIAGTVHALLESCTTATMVDSIPAVSYKGVRITQTDGKVIETYIFPDSRNSYMVRIYTKENGIIRLHGKYTDHAYQLISMLELKP